MHQIQKILLIRVILKLLLEVWIEAFSRSSLEKQQELNNFLKVFLLQEIEIGLQPGSYNGYCVHIWRNVNFMSLFFLRLLILM